MDTFIQLIKQNIINQAKYYLEEAGEFYPFGVIVNDRQEIQPISIFFGEEYPKSTEVFEKLEDALKNGIENKHYLAGGIGIDVFINKNTEKGVEKKTALQINVYSGEDMKVCYFVYFNHDNQYMFEEITLNHS